MDLTSKLAIVKYGVQKSAKYFAKNFPRIALGYLLLFVGLNSFFGFFKTPDPSSASITFLMGLSSAVYFFPLLKGLEIVCGLLLILRMYMTLAITVLAPIIVNIIAFHVYLDLTNFVLAAVAVLLYGVIVWQNRRKLSFLLRK